MSSHASGQAGWPRHAWLVPAALAAAAIGLLCWGAWVYGYDPRWLERRAHLVAAPAAAGPGLDARGHDGAAA